MRITHTTHSTAHNSHVFDIRHIFSRFFFFCIFSILIFCASLRRFVLSMLAQYDLAPRIAECERGAVLAGMLERNIPIRRISEWHIECRVRDFLSLARSLAHSYAALAAGQEFNQEQYMR